MENQGQNSNISRGNTRSASLNARGPYKKDTFRKFVEWSVMTSEEKKDCGIPNARAFAVKHKLHGSQLSRWAQRKEFNTMRFEHMRERWSAFVPEAFEALRKRIQRFGMSRDVELWLAYSEGWNGKMIVPLVPPTSFGEDDIRTLLEYLPKEEQLEFRRTLAKLLLKARDAQEKELQNYA